MRMRPAVRFEHTILLAVECGANVFSENDMYAQWGTRGCSGGQRRKELIAEPEIRAVTMFSRESEAWTFA
jgi:hypothetical protein